MLFYTNVCGNVTDSYKKTELLQTLKGELLTALQPALAKISAQGVRPYEIPGFSMDICNLLAEELTGQWTELRGLQMVKMSINNADMLSEDRERFQKWQDTAMLRNTDMQAARKTEAFSNMMENMGGGDGNGGSVMDGAMNMMAMGMMNNMMGGNAFGGGMGMNQGMGQQNMNMMNQGMNQQAMGAQMPKMQAPRYLLGLRKVRTRR